MSGRRAWLVMGDERVELDDPDAGYVCQELDLGWPEVREVTSNRPDVDGTDDRTRLLGSRVVTASILAFGERLTIDEVAHLFGRFLLPSARPELHWCEDTPGDSDQERMLVLRPSAFSSPMTRPVSRSVALGWVAPDPVMWDPEVHMAYARPALAGVRFGRQYPLVFDRHYPAGSGGGQVAIVQSSGDVLVRPVIRIYGPITGPYLAMTFMVPVVQTWVWRFLTTFRVDAGRWVDVDVLNKTVRMDDGANVLDQVEWYNSRWLIGQPRVQLLFSINGEGLGNQTQAVILWRDGYVA